MQTERKILSVPEPCSEDWNAMSESEKGRYCDVCDKTVVDFSGMSDEEMIHTIEEKKVQGIRVCGHFHNSQLNRPMQTVLQYSRQYFALPVLASGAMLLSSMQIEEGQERVYCKTTGVIAIENTYFTEGELVVGEVNMSENVVHGRVVDTDGKPIAYATVLPYKNENIKPVISDRNGEFMFEKSESESLILYAISNNKSSSAVIIPQSSNVPYITFTIERVGKAETRIGKVAASSVTEHHIETSPVAPLNISEFENHISGILTDDNGNPIADAMITFEGVKNGMRSQKDGTFTLPSLLKDDYTITITHENYKKKEIYHSLPSEFKRISIVMESK